MSSSAPINVLGLGSFKIGRCGYRPFFILPHQLAQCPFLLFKPKENCGLVKVGHLVDRQDTAVVINHVPRAADPGMM
jgi:hypothetical protein